MLESRYSVVIDTNVFIRGVTGIDTHSLQIYRLVKAHTLINVATQAYLLEVEHVVDRGYVNGGDRLSKAAKNRLLEIARLSLIVKPTDSYSPAVDVVAKKDRGDVKFVRAAEWLIGHGINPAYLITHDKAHLRSVDAELYLWGISVVSAGMFMERLKNGRITETPLPTFFH